MNYNKILKQKSILVTGASGFIGSTLCTQLTNIGANIHGVSRTHQENAPDGVIWHQLDLADNAAVKQLFNEVRPEYICHLASEVAGSRDLCMVHTTFNANLVSTVNLLVAATETGCQRFLTAGSLEEPDPEESLPIPSSPYAASKLASSNYLRMFNALYGTPAVLARIFMVYGPAQRDLTKLVPYVILSLLHGKQPQLTNGNRLVDWIYVEDIVDGLLKMLVTPGIEGDTIELGSSKYNTTGAVAETIHHLIGKDIDLKIGALPERPMEQVRAANLAETERKLGWKPKIGLEEGLRRTIDWYRSELESDRITYNILEKKFQFK